MVTGAVQLEVVAGKAAGMTILVDDELLIGRHAEAPGRLADDDEISRSHAVVTVAGGGLCAIEDLGSTNGTYVNGLRIASPTTLGPGDTIELGGTTLVVRGVPVADTPAVPPPPAADGPPPLMLRLQVDFSAREVEMRLDDTSDAVRFVLEGSTWRAVTDQAVQKGGPR